MSHWSFITGTITVETYAGTTQPELNYIIQSVLQTLPDVNPSLYTKPYYSSEHHFDIFLNNPSINRVSSSHDDNLVYAGHRTYNLENKNRFVPNYNQYYDPFKSLETCTTYILTLNGVFRDAFFGPTLKDFINWLNRLSIKLYVHDMCVKIEGDRGDKHIVYTMTDENEYWGNRYEGNEFEDMFLNLSREKMMKIQGNKK